MALFFISLRLCLSILVAIALHLRPSWTVICKWRAMHFLPSVNKMDWRDGRRQKSAAPLMAVLPEELLIRLFSTRRCVILNIEWGV